MAGLPADASSHNPTQTGLRPLCEPTCDGLRHAPELLEAATPEGPATMQRNAVLFKLVLNHPTSGMQLPNRLLGNY